MSGRTVCARSFDSRCQRSRSRREAQNSDADQVGRLTHVPGIFWVVFFAAIALASLALGARWLIEPAL